MAQYVGMNLVVFPDVVRSRSRRKSHYLDHRLPIFGVGGLTDQTDLGGGVGPVRARVRQVLPERLVAITVRHVRGEVAGLASQELPRGAAGSPASTAS